LRCGAAVWVRDEVMEAGNVALEDEEAMECSVLRYK
jgi:hypothetical protein